MLRGYWFQAIRKHLALVPVVSLVAGALPPATHWDPSGISDPGSRQMRGRPVHFLFPSPQCSANAPFPVQQKTAATGRLRRFL